YGFQGANMIRQVEIGQKQYKKQRERYRKIVAADEKRQADLQSHFGVKGIAEGLARTTGDIRNLMGLASPIGVLGAGARYGARHVPGGRYLPLPAGDVGRALQTYRQGGVSGELLGREVAPDLAYVGKALKNTFLPTPAATPLAAGYAGGPVDEEQPG